MNAVRYSMGSQWVGETYLPLPGGVFEASVACHELPKAIVRVRYDSNTEQLVVSVSYDGRAIQTEKFDVKTLEMAA